ncbi:UDP-glucose 6-dehydrogenase 5 [Sorghum bicolor]|uniref:UDP-glucose 6-dehydrogenase 5 n=1 Tax=Sorghum bicolor TaxID=4558 RepID=UPI0001A83658|nr:UDP-glucose 6-dehydrogenase 5 [Sorghum bicolor]|eukprot:XP_002461326.1 UDP-glucose 6-dehydrogenase 5 [Sorghum bicolor]
MVKICCIGAGYVGGPSMAVMALKCPAIEVTVVDVSRPRIDAWNSDRLPVLEPGLDTIVRACRGRNLSFSADVDRHVADADIVFVSVNTPTKARGLGTGRAPDLAYWESAARVVAAASRPGTGKIVVEKSAVPVRTAEAMERILHAHAGDGAFQVLSNPEFFSEGTAVRDLLCPDRVVIGGGDTDVGAVRALVDVYAHWVPEDRIVTTGLQSAELAKLAASALLAQRVSSVNALSALCEATGADVSDVARAVGSDGRVGGGGRGFLDAGVGFGGPSLRRDVLSLAYDCERHGLHEAAEYWRQVVAVNEYQKGRFVRRLVASMLGTVAGKKVAVLGLAFKKGVGDTRESPAVDVCRALLAEGARVSVYDPVVSETQIIRRDTAAAAAEVEVTRDAYEAADGAHGLCVLTEWDEFRTLDYRRVFDGMMRPAFVFDGRNVVDAGELREIGFVVYSVGKPLDAWLNGMPAVA